MDNKYKAKVIETVASNIDKNYDTLSDVLETEYEFPALDPVRYEICLCLMSGLNQAALTLTNHLLESVLKKFLILHDSPCKTQNSSELTSVFADATEKYADKKLFDLIEDAYAFGLINNQEKEQLHVFRKVYRNPYSHANPRQTLPDRPLPIRLLFKDEIESVADFHKFFAPPNVEVNPQNFLPMQGVLQVLLAETCAKDYFLKVDDIVRRINKRLHSEGAEEK